MLIRNTATNTVRGQFLHTAAVPGLLLLGWLGLLVVAHIPTHLGSALGRLLRLSDWIDAVQLAPAALTTLFWLPLAMIVMALLIRNQGSAVAAERPMVQRLDLMIALLVTLLAVGLRLFPLLVDPWIKPDYDEGVYLGGAWLLSNGALPYRDFVFPHLPGAPLMLWPAAHMLQNGHDNSVGLFAARTTALLCDGLAAGLIFLAARQLVQWPGALLAAIVYLSDVLVINFSRGVRLEPLQAPWLAAGALLVLSTLNGRRHGVAAGLCFALGLMVKITAVVVPAAAVVILLFERRWTALRDFVLGSLLGALAVCGWFVATSGTELLRQTIMLQLIRPSDSADGRWAFLLADRSTAFTAAMFVLGIGTLCLRALKERVASGWLFVCLWIVLTLALFAYGSSFYDHYYVKLALPIALASAGVWNSSTGLQRRWLPLSGLTILLISLLVGQAQLWLLAKRSPISRQEVDAALRLPPEANVVNFMPLSSLVAGRSFTKPPDGPYVLDTFLGTAYLDSSLNRRWPNAEATMGAVISKADFVIVDPWTAPLPGLSESFMEQPLIEGSRTRLFTRVDQPAHIVQITPELELLQLSAGRVELVNGQRWLVQPLHWRAAQTPPPDQALALHLSTVDGKRVAQLDVPISGDTTWQPHVVTTIEYRMPLADELQTGTYQLTTTAYSWTTGKALAEPISLQPVTITP